MTSLLDHIRASAGNGHAVLKGFLAEACIACDVLRDELAEKERQLRIAIGNGKDLAGQFQREREKNESACDALEKMEVGLLLPDSQRFYVQAIETLKGR